MKSKKFTFVIRKPIVFLGLIILSGCVFSRGMYTLYRNSVLDESMRIHVATFDASEGEAYNRDNCTLAAELFQKQEGVQTKCWCEAGKFKK